jgi:hypothetical protein
MHIWIWQREMHPLSAGKGQYEAGRQRKNPRLRYHNLALCMFQLIMEGGRMFDSGLVALL